MLKATVGIFSDASPLASLIVKNLLTKNCKIVIFSKNSREWQRKGFHASIYSDITYSAENTKQLDYAIILETNTPLATQDIILSYVKKGTLGRKNLFLLNYRNLSSIDLSRYLPSNMGVVYLGDLVDNGKPLQETPEISRIVSQSYSKKEIEIVKGEYLYPVEISEVTDLICRWIFSFGPFGEEVAILSHGISVETLLDSLRIFVPGLSVIYIRQVRQEPLRKVKKFIVRTNTNLRISKPLAKTQTPYAVPKKPTGLEQFKYVSFLAAPMSLFFLSPIIFLLLSLSCLFFSKAFIRKLDFQNSKNLLSAARVFAQTSNIESSFFSKVPLIGQAYKPIRFFSEIGIQVSLAGDTSINLIEDSRILFDAAFDRREFSPNRYSENIGNELGYLYDRLSLIENEIKTASKGEKSIVFSLAGGAGDKEIAYAKMVISEFKAIAVELPDILGAKTRRTYLLLLQNNMELRPTGGFLGSFALITFEKGRITNIDLQDIYSADGQLKGHVEPPVPIKKYLGEANWYMRDANWDPDFPSSASKIEWFLDKELGRSVDGVIAIDLEVMKSILSVTGPVNISDFNTKVDSQNLYEITQAQAESNFFPGSRKKANFLTALSKSFIAEVGNLKGNDRAKLGRVIFDNLNEKHVQIFLHNKNSQTAISTLGWDGSLSVPNCEGNCISDWLAVVEANLGVNKVNYYIQREFGLFSELSSGKVFHVLSIYYQNSGSRSLGASGKYKTFLRVFLPENSSISSFKTGNENSLENVTFEEETRTDKRAIGSLVEILPGEKKKVEIRWTLSGDIDFKSKGEYRFLWRKQSGTEKDAIYLNYKLPTGPNYSLSPESFLTKGGTFIYNTNLARDFVSRIYWK